jgi:hypothetical protein
MCQVRILSIGIHAGFVPGDGIGRRGDPRCAIVGSTQELCHTTAIS